MNCLYPLTNLDKTLNHFGLNQFNKSSPPSPTTFDTPSAWVAHNHSFRVLSQFLRALSDHEIPPFHPASPYPLFLALLTSPSKRKDLSCLTNENACRSQDWSILPTTTVPLAIILLNKVSLYYVQICLYLTISANYMLNYYLRLLNVPLHKLKKILKQTKKWICVRFIWYSFIACVFYLMHSTIDIGMMFSFIHFQNNMPETGSLKNDEANILLRKKEEIYYYVHSCN